MLCLMLVTGVTAKLKLPAVITDHMVIQAGEAVNVWGWADKGQKVTVTIDNHRTTVRTAKDGTWRAVLPAMNYGGPYTMTVTTGKESLTVSDILVGEVWVASGQSNMEFRLCSADNAEEAALSAHNSGIRVFTVERTMAKTPQADVVGSWTVSTPETVGDFTAVGYLFARELAKRLNCAVGIINTSWGGTDIETWMSPKAIESFPKYNPLVEEMRTADLDAQAKRWQVLKAKFDKAVREE